MKRVVIITGSTRGIGFSTAAGFLKHGDLLVILCRHKAHVEKARRQLALAAPTENIVGLVGDVRNSKDVKHIIVQCMKRFGRIDILINNAGIGAYKEIELVSEKEWDDVLDTNLKGTFLFIRQVLPIMKRQRSGIIINISSGLGVSGEAKFSAYCASKFGVVGLTQVVADEAAESGIKVYAVLPGAVNTRLITDVGLEMDPSELMTPDYLARRIFEVSEGKERTGKSTKSMRNPE